MSNIVVANFLFTVLWCTTCQTTSMKHNTTNLKLLMLCFIQSITVDIIVIPYAQLRGWEFGCISMNYVCAKMLALYVSYCKTVAKACKSSACSGSVGGPLKIIYVIHNVSRCVVIHQPECWLHYNHYIHQHAAVVKYYTLHVQHMQSNNAQCSQPGVYICSMELYLAN